MRDQAERAIKLAVLMTAVELKLDGSVRMLILSRRLHALRYVETHKYQVAKTVKMGTLWMAMGVTLNASSRLVGHIHKQRTSMATLQLQVQFVVMD